MLMGLSSIRDPGDRTSGTICSSVIQATGVRLWLVLVALKAVSAVDE